MLSDLVLPVGGWLAGLLLVWRGGGDPVPVLAVSAVVAVGGLLYVLVTRMRGWWNVPAIVATVLSMLVAGDLSGSGWAMLCPLAALAFAVTVWADTGLKAWRGPWGTGRARREPGRGRGGVADADGSDSVGPPAPPVASDGFGAGLGRFLLANQLDMPWDADADRQAEANGYEGVVSCVARLKAGDRRVCHEGTSGFIDFGTVNWDKDDRIDRINGLSVRTEADVRVMGEEGAAGSVRCRGALLLDDCLFAAPDMALWKSDESLAPDPAARGESPVVGVCGLQVNPERTWIIPWRDVRGVHVTGDGTIMCDLGGGTELAVDLDGKPGMLRNILNCGATAAWHGRVRSIATMIDKARQTESRHVHNLVSEGGVNTREVINLIDRLGSRIGAPYDAQTYPHVYESFDRVWNDGRSIYIDDNGDIHVAFFERGKLVSDETDPDPVVALYPILRGQAAIQAGAYARAHRVEGQDHRRTKFKKELELLDQVLPLYAEMDAKDIHELLQDNPFMDGEPIGDFLDKYLGKE